MRIALVVLRSLDPDRLSKFYTSIGIPMVVEQHGSGPRHFAADFGTGVIEIYPSKQAQKTTFGLAVSSPEAFLSNWVSAGGTSSASGMAIDPDGNTVHLTAE